MIKLQTIFSRAVNGILKQGGPCITDGQCRYRGDGSEKCVVGQLIKKKHYDAYQMEGRGFSVSNAVGRAVVASIGVLPRKAIPLLLALQSAHDELCENHNFIGDFCKRVETIADKYKLSMDGIKVELVEDN